MYRTSVDATRSSQPRASYAHPALRVPHATSSVEIVEPAERNEFALHLRNMPSKPYKFRAKDQTELLTWVRALKTIIAVQDESGGNRAARAR